VATFLTEHRHVPALRHDLAHDQRSSVVLPVPLGPITA